MLRFYIEVGRTAYRRQLIYRWANLAGLLTNLFFGAIFSSVLIALYHARPVVRGYSLQDALRYTWLVQAMIMVVLPFGWFDLLRTIATGDVASDLSKPCDFYWYWFSREAGRDLYYLLFRGLPTFALGALLFGFGLPGGPDRALLFAISLGLGAALGIAYRFLYNVVSFWLIEGRAVVTLAATVALFFTGSYIPVAFFPPGLRSFAEWSPFSGLMNVPAALFTGKIAGAGPVALALGRQAGWLVLLTLAARGLTHLATRRVVVQGG